MTLARIHYQPIRSSLHGNENASLVVVDHGCCVKALGRRQVQLHRRTAIFLPAGCPQQDSFTTETSFLSVELSPSFLNHFLDRDQDGLLDDFWLLPNQDAMDLNACLTRELGERDHLSDLVLEAQVSRILTTAFRSRQSTKGQPPKWLRIAKEHLTENYAAPFRHEQLAQSAGVHPAHFARQFQHWYEMSAGEYVRQLRVKAAQMRLRETGETILTIAMDLGFSDQAHFCKVFRRHTGLTPSAFRRLDG
jgi:AraC-like DNA-binding protein